MFRLKSRKDLELPLFLILSSLVNTSQPCIANETSTTTVINCHSGLYKSESIYNSGKNP